MKPLVETIVAALEQNAPRILAESWDNIGLLIGNHTHEVSSILVALDPSTALIDEAVSLGANTIVTHHPVIFKPLSQINTSDPAGRLLQTALKNDINIIACHTNLDSAADGINDILAHELGLENLFPLEAAGSDRPAEGLGRIGTYPTPLSWNDFVDRLHDVLNLNSFNIAGPPPHQITRVALCGGSGSEFARLAQQKGADVYLSSEIRHDVAVWANQADFCIIDGTHYATEKPGTRQIANILTTAATEGDWQTTIHLSETEHHPFVTVHKYKHD